MSKSLPPKPSFTNLRKQAKTLLNGHKSGDVGICGTFRLIHRFSGSTDQEILQASVSLQEAQYALALDYGFSGWKELKAHVEEDEGTLPSILYIDDDSVILDLVAELLKGDYDVTTASDGNTGIKALEDSKYDLVLTDVNHPGPTGIDVLAHVVANCPGTRCIIITGDPTISYGKAMGLGASDVRSKPIKLTELRAVVEKALQLKQRESGVSLEEVQKAVIGIADELFDILSPIMVRAEMTLFSLPEDSPQRDNMREILSAGNRARDLVNQIQDRLYMR